MPHHHAFRRITAAIVLIAVVSGAGPASLPGFVPVAAAHEFWIEPSSFDPRVGETVGLRLRVGERFRGDALPREGRRIRRFTATRATGTAAVIGIEGTDPAGWLRPRTPGVRVVGYGSHPSFVELEARRFETYLLEEGLESVLAKRRQRGERSRPGRELFERCAKSILVARHPGGREGTPRPDPDVCGVVLGMPLEIIPRTHPLAIPDGGRFDVELLYEGRPIEGVRVVAIAQDDPAERLAVRTDAEGRAAFDLPRGGTWLVHGVHMVRSGSPDADWASYWASLTFRTRLRDS